MMIFVKAWPACAALAVIAAQKNIARKIASLIFIGHLRDADTRGTREFGQGVLSPSFDKIRITGFHVEKYFSIASDLHDS